MSPDFSTPQKKDWSHPLLAFVLTLIVIWAAAYGSTLVAQREEEDVAKETLHTIQEAAHESLRLWAGEKAETVQQLADNVTLRAHVERLLALPRDPQALLTSPAQKTLREFFTPLLQDSDYRGFFVIAPDNISLASSRDGNIGTPNLLIAQPDILKYMWAGSPTLAHPMPTDVALGSPNTTPSANTPTMFVGAPIRDSTGSTIALLTLCIDPYLGPYRSLLQGRIGETGETYIVDHQGRLLSPLRFSLTGHAGGASPAGDEPADFFGHPLAIPGDASETRSSGPVAQPPFTEAVAAVIAGRAGDDLQGYPGYRGEETVGVWSWDEDLRLGIITEIAVSEVYKSLHQTEWFIYLGSATATLLILILLWVVGRSRRHLRATRARWQGVFDTAVDGMVIIDAHGIVQNINPAITRLFGYSSREMIGRNVSMLMPEPHRSAHDGYLQHYLTGGPAQIIGIGREVQGLRKDGSLFPFDLSISEITANGERHFAGIVHDVSQRKEMEDALEAQRQFNNDTLDGLSESIAVLNEKGVVIFVNQRWREFAHANGGATAELGLGENYLSVTEAAAADDAHAAEAAERLRALLTGQADDFTLTYPCHSPDTQRWFQMRATRFEHRGQLRIAVSHQDISAQIKAKAALREASDRLRTMAMVAQGTHNAVIVTDVAGCITWVNRGFVELTGYDLQNVAGRKPGDVLQGPKTDQETVRRLGEAIEQGLPIEVDLVNYDRQGNPYWVRLSVSPIRDEAGEIIQFVSIGQDISGQRQLFDELEVAKDMAESAVKELAKNQNVLHLAMEGAGAGTWQFDPVSGEAGWDVQSSKIYGMPAKNFRGKYQDWAQRIHPDDREQAEQTIQSQLADKSQSKANLEYRILRPDGETRYLQVSGSIERDNQGEPVAAFGLHFDLTERWRAQQEVLRAKHAVEAANRDLRITLQAMGEVGLALFWIDATNARILKASEYAGRRLGYNERQLPQLAWPDLCPEFSEEVFVERLALMRELGFGRFESILQTRDGEIFPVEVLSFYRPASDDTPPTLITFVTDISERKQAEADLIMSREAAEAANRAKSNFLAAMSHEIRTPINGVVGVADLLYESKLDADQRSMVRTMRSSALALRTIIDDILDFSKIEAGKLRVESVALSPITLIEEVAETLAPAADEKGIELLVDIDPRLDHCYLGDPVRLRQVLYNLGSNAVKFTQNQADRHGRVTLRLEMLDDAQGDTPSMTFHVIDNGIGIAPEAQGKLFRPFMQAEDSTTRRFGGTGLGLSISRHLAKLMGGEITFSSTAGEGSTFSMRLALAPTPCIDDQRTLGNWQFKDTEVLLIGADRALVDNIGHLLDFYQACLVSCDTADAVACLGKSQQAAGAFAVILGSDAAARHEHDICQAVRDTHSCIVLQPRTQSAGDLEYSTRLRSHPLLPSELMRALAVALGQASPGTVAAQMPQQIEAREPPTRDVAEAEGRLILVAEDNETNREVITRQLSMLGYAHYIGVDGVDALALWHRHRFGLVLTDCHMPEMDGYALSQAIRAAEPGQGSHVPIIAVTANALKGEAERCYAAGMDDYLTKPVELLALQKLLAKWLPSEQPASGDAKGKKSDVTATPATPATPPVDDDITPVDPSVLAKIVGDDPAVVVSFLKKFVPQAQAILAELDEAFTAHDPDAIRFHCHKLKSSARAVGAIRLADLCAELETAGRENAWADVERLSPQLAVVMSSVVGYVDKL